MYGLGLLFICIHSVLCIVYTAGTFGQVVECWDLETKETVAIKIVRSLQKYREAAMIEIDVLQKLAKHDFTGTRYVYFPPYCTKLLINI